MVTPKEIKELREKIDATQAEFARALGVSFSTISRWENDEAQPSDTQEEQLDALKQILEDKKANIDKKGLRVLVWVKLYLLEHTGKDFKAKILLIS